jgi:ParB family chromosome partitioning protein
MELAIIDNIKQALAKVNSPDEIKELRGKAAAIEVYGRRQGNREIQNQGALGCIRCDQRLAEVYNEMQDRGELNGHGGNRKSSLHDANLKSADFEFDPSEIHRCRKLLAVPEDILQEFLYLVNASLDGELTIIGLLRYNSGDAKDIERISSKSTNEWWTPKEYIESARAVLGQIDIDPASSELANETVQANIFYTKKNNGLEYNWPGRVWLNPPYGGIARDFVARLVQQYENGITTEAILLVNSNSTETAWFAPCWNYILCFTNHRINFVTSHSVAKGSTHGSVFVYFGKNVESFVRNFRQFGRIVKAIDDLS